MQWYFYWIDVEENDDEDLEDDNWEDEESMLGPEFSDDEMSSHSSQSQRMLKAVAIYSFQVMHLSINYFITRTFDL